MYVRPISTFLSRGRSMPEIRAILYQPWRCLCLGLRLQMMRVTPLRFTTLQCSQIGFTLVRTFTGAPTVQNGSSLWPDPYSNGGSNLKQGAGLAVAHPLQPTSGRRPFAQHNTSLGEVRQLSLIHIS